LSPLGHLGELTQIVPFEMVDRALAATGTTQARIRMLPARVVVCLLLAGCLFAELGYRQVWHKLTAGLGGLLVCAIDSTTMAIPGSPRNLAVHGKQADNHGGPGYPLLRLVTLVACGTRAVIDAVSGPASCGELDCTRRLRRSLHAGMLVLLDAR
jgi:hypothetical protein